MANVKMPLSEQIMDLVNAQGADRITITMDRASALALAKIVEWADGRVACGLPEGRAVGEIVGPFGKGLDPNPRAGVDK